MKIKFKVTLFCVITFLFSPIISRRVIVAEEQQWQPVPEANYADVLELIAFRAKANYDEIVSWQGQMNILETSHDYGPDAAEKSHAVDTTNSIARNSQHICRVGKTIAKFAVDMRNDKLYSSVEPNVQYKAVDLDQYVPIRKSTSTPKVKTILSPEGYMWYMPEEKFNPMFHKGRLGKTVFIESPQNENVKGFVRDPRIFFDSSGEGGIKLWESLLKNLRISVTEHINTRIAGYPHIEISSLNTENGVKYRILTTWQGEKNSMTNYIRCLLEVDEAVSFNAIRTETTNSEGIRTDLKEYTYKKIGEIYIPKAVKKEQRNDKGEIAIISEIAIETTGLNKPLPEDTFTIKNLGIEEDTLVSDKIKKAEFRFRKGELVPIAEPNK
ncbi:MAG: hypothetical protein JW725_02225 [Candidatus Babeliaceae bacterium]|nr:hypothetical protein [Candidatus Babeliaceae bacterium]